MKKPKQIELFETKRGDTKRHVVYLPPDESILKKLAREVCVRLSKRGNQAYCDTEVIEGFGDYLTVIARLSAKACTNGGAVWRTASGALVKEKEIGMSLKKKLKRDNRNIALCYVRQSWTRNPDDMDSPERQRSNIQAICDAHGWKAKWFTDAEGHKTGTKVSNRPGWLALEAHLSDPDVVAIVANDLARLHRKGWRIGNLLDFVDEHDVKLVLAAPGKQMDFSTPQGRALAQMSAIFDEWYAIDISQRVKDMIAFRKRNGKSVGLPPFGTVRNEEGYLIRSSEGAWLLPDGKLVKGTEDKQPDEGALWRGYYETAHHILKLYAQNKMGINSIAYRMQIRRLGIPRPRR